MMDTISDMIIRMKNATMAGKTSVSIPYSKFKSAIAEKLKARGFFSDVAYRGKNVQKTIECTFAKTEKGFYRFSDVRRVSKLGKRVYVSSKEIARVRGGFGFSILSTPKGVLFGDEARKEGVGGEVLFEIW